MTAKRQKPKGAKKRPRYEPLIGHMPAARERVGDAMSRVEGAMPISLASGSSRRQSITFPEELWQQIERAANEQHETFSRTALRYMRQGIREEARAKERLREVVRKIQAAGSDEDADAYVDELTEALFGPQRVPRA